MSAPARFELPAGAAELLVGLMAASVLSQVVQLLPRGRKRDRAPREAWTHLPPGYNNPHALHVRANYHGNLDTARFALELPIIPARLAVLVDALEGSR